MTDPRDIIARQLDRSGTILLHALEPLTDEEFYAENVNGYSAAWTAGHLAAVCDLFRSWMDGRLPQLDRSFHTVFNDTGTALTTQADKTAAARCYPKVVLLQRLDETVTRALGVLAGFDAAQWDAPGPPGTPRSLRTCGDVWEHLAVHCYWHSGELAGSMLRFHGTYTLNPMSHYFYSPPED